MTSDNKNSENKKDIGSSTRNSLIIKIALFLNYISKTNHKKLLQDLSSYDASSQPDAIEIMIAKNYISHADLAGLKKACLCFAKPHKDSRLGALSIDFGFLTKGNLDLALEEQQTLAEQGQSIKIGSLLVDAGMISQRQKKLLLHKQEFEKSKAAKKPKPESSNSQQPAQDAPAPVQPEDKPERQTSPPEELMSMELEAPVDTSSMREIKEETLTIFISNNGIKAYIIKTSQFDDSIIYEELKFLLEQYGIIYGLVSDDSLEKFIKEIDYHSTMFLVATGIEPVDGSDSQIRYLFERDYLKPGELTEDGTIDYKERGKIPFVSQGELLAEKIPLIEGKDGINVYGETIPHIEARDISFKLGKGVKLSEDEQQVVAATEGNPKLKQGGELSVNDAYFIEGNVDYTTGHIKFDKNVFITGTIKNGFKVEAIDVVAKSIDGGTINAKGDVFIQAGASESELHAKGNIKAGFMHKCSASCLGNVQVVKEAVDTEILMEGSFSMEKGSLFSSNITAKAGASIYNIGSEKSRPSSITVGTSTYIDQELENIDDAIKRSQNILEHKTVSKNKAEEELGMIIEKLKNFDDSRQRTLNMIEEMKKQKDDNKIDLFQQSLEEADEKIKELNDQKTKIEKQFEKLSENVAGYAEAVKEHVKDKFTLKRLSQTNPSNPVLNVAGKIYSGTKVHGKHSSLIIRNLMSKSKIMEIQEDASQDEKSGSVWKMTIINL